MKKAVVVTLMVAAICVISLILWNPVIVVHSYSETRTWTDYSWAGENEFLAKRRGLGREHKQIVTVIVKQRLLTGETWKECLEEGPK